MENPVSNLISETITFTLAELHVHGILGLSVIAFKWLGHEVSEDHIAIGITIAGGCFALFYFRHRRMIAQRALKARGVRGWVTKNF